MSDELGGVPAGERLWATHSGGGASSTEAITAKYDWSYERDACPGTQPDRIHCPRAKTRVRRGRPTPIPKWVYWGPISLAM